MKKKLIDLIAVRLEDNLEAMRSDFLTSCSDVGVRYCVVDDLLPEDIVKNIHNYSIRVSLILSSFLYTLI